MIDLRWVDVATLTPTFDRRDNPNKMEQQEYELLVRSMGVSGFLQPILVEERGDAQLVIIDGHHRWWAAQEAGISKVSVFVASLGEAADAVGLAMNKLRGQADMTIVSQMMRNILIDTGWVRDELSVTTGYTVDEIASLLDSTRTISDDVLNDGMQGLQDAVPDAKPYTLEVAFATKEELQLVKRKLKKAAGKGNDLGVGLLQLLCLEP